MKNWPAVWHVSDSRCYNSNYDATLIFTLGTIHIKLASPADTASEWLNVVLVQRHFVATSFFFNIDRNLSTHATITWVFRERELTFTFAKCHRPSVCRLSVCLLSVTLVRPTQAVQIFGNISMALGTLAIYWHPLKISRRSSQRNPSAGGVKHKRGSKI